MNLDEILTLLYSKEINVSIVSAWDAGYRVSVLNGMLQPYEVVFCDQDGIAEELIRQAKKYYPQAGWIGV